MNVLLRTLALIGKEFATILKDPKSRFVVIPSIHMSVVDVKEEQGSSRLRNGGRTPVEDE